MYFGGTTSNFNPNSHQNPSQAAHYDHLWPGREDGSVNGRRDKQQQYAEELRKQMAEKEAQKKREKQQQNSGDYPATNYSRTTGNIIGQSQAAASTQNRTMPIQQKTNDVYAKTQPISNYTMPSSDFTRTNPASSLARTSQFSETLRSQIDECRKSNYSALAQPIQPLSLNQPMPTFPGSATFDTSQFDMPNVSILMRAKPLSDRQHVRSISMDGASSMRSSLQTYHSQPPVIDYDSPLNRSKIATPSMGFSCRNINTTRASYPSKFSTDSTATTSNNFNDTFHGTATRATMNSTFGNTTSAIGSLNNTSKFANTRVSFQTTNPDGSLFSDSQMLYPDGHRSPV